MSNETTELQQVADKYDLDVSTISIPELQAQDSEQSDVEKEAVSMGWDPNKSDGVDAKEYIRVGKIISKERSKAEKEIAELKQTVSAMSDHLKKTEQAAYTKALQEVQDQMRVAEENYDFESFKQLNADYATIQQEIQKQVAPEQKETKGITPQLQKAVSDFHERNKDWYNVNTKENSAMFAFAVAASAEIHKNNPAISPEDELKEVEKQVRNHFPDRFKTKKDEPRRVESRGYDKYEDVSSDEVASLTPQQKYIWKLMQGKADISLKDYLRQVKLQNEVK
jgi:hypothetical protein